MHKDCLKLNLADEFVCSTSNMLTINCECRLYNPKSNKIEPILYTQNSSFFTQWLDGNGPLAKEAYDGEESSPLNVFQLYTYCKQKNNDFHFECSSTRIYPDIYAFCDCKDKNGSKKSSIFEFDSSKVWPRERSLFEMESPSVETTTESSEDSFTSTMNLKTLQYSFYSFIPAILLMFTVFLIIKNHQHITRYFTRHSYSTRQLIKKQDRLLYQNVRYKSQIRDLR